MSDSTSYCMEGFWGLLPGRISYVVSPNGHSIYTLFDAPKEPCIHAPKLITISVLVFVLQDSLSDFMTWLVLPPMISVMLRWGRRGFRV